MEAPWKDRIVILDGATGTNLIEQGMSAGECTELFISENKELLVELQREYVKAGSEILLAPTFGLNRVKLSKYGLEGRMEELAEQLVGLTRKAADGKALVAADLSGLGLFLAPAGESTFEELVSIYKEQVECCLKAGVDLFFIETVMTIEEARAALLAVKELCDKPVAVCMTFTAGGRTITGVDAMTALMTLQSMGADAFGMNCSTGAQDMLLHIERISPYARIPIIAKPNAGLPETVNGKSLFTQTPEEFARLSRLLRDVGASMLGGCCGTTPMHIKALSEELSGLGALKPVCEEGDETIIVTTANEVHFLSRAFDLSKEIECGSDMDMEIMDAEGDGVSAIKISLSSRDDLEFFEENAYLIKLPVLIDTQDIDLLESAARLYQGRLMFDKAEHEPASPELIRLQNKYGLIII